MSLSCNQRERDGSVLLQHIFPLKKKKKENKREKKKQKQQTQERDFLSLFAF